jgi:hypothetical protein
MARKSAQKAGKNVERLANRIFPKRNAGCSVSAQMIKVGVFHSANALLPDVNPHTDLNPSTPDPPLFCCTSPLVAQDCALAIPALTPLPAVQVPTLSPPACLGRIPLDITTQIVHARSGAMPDHMRDHPVALSTAPIFDDAVYLSEALGLPVNQNEDDLDAELALLARESGIQDPYRFISPPKSISRAISTMTLDSDHRSSRSIHSQETQSTSVTSAPSRTSRDHLFPSERPLPKRVPPKPVRAPPSVDTYEQAMERPGSGIRSRQSSTLSITPSDLSSSSSQQVQRRKKRSSAIFSLFRRDYKLVNVSTMTGSLLTTLIVPAFRTHTKDTTPSRAAQSSNAAIRYPHTTFVNTYKKRCVLGHIQCRVAVGEHYHTRC